MPYCSMWFLQRLQGKCMPNPYYFSMAYSFFLFCSFIFKNICLANIISVWHNTFLFFRLLIRLSVCLIDIILIWHIFFSSYTIKAIKIICLLIIISLWHIFHQQWNLPMQKILCILYIVALWHTFAGNVYCFESQVLIEHYKIGCISCL